MRHGATEPNLLGLRCGGDVDVPLASLGVTQVRRAAKELRALSLPVDVIVTSDLQRTQATARLISEVLGGVPILVEAGLRERSLGRWNLQPISVNEKALADGQTPPDGESNDVFSRRIQTALAVVRARVGGYRMPLVVGSKGVARIFLEHLVLRSREGGDAQQQSDGHAATRSAQAPAGNAELMWFDLSPSNLAEPLHRTLAVPETQASRTVSGVTN
jgi:2,3-bisphosphoglycerate-dependent phosphoglycerate mutase